MNHLQLKGKLLLLYRGEFGEAFLIHNFLSARLDKDEFDLHFNPIVHSFRAWFCVTDTQDSSSATKWLETWLRRKLNLKDGVSPKRLACAALVRVLLWADEECSALDLNDCDDENDLMLASVIGFDIKFLAEISHACVGLIQSIPTKLQPGIISGIGNANVNTSAIFSFEVEGQHSLSLDGSVEL